MNEPAAMNDSGQSDDRHLRQRALDGWSDAAQQRLAGAYVVVVGAGAIGASVAAHLAAAGVGHIGIVDGAVIDTQALGAQTVHFTPDRGNGKADSVVHKLALLNPEVHVDPFPAFVDAQNAAAIITGATLVVDCARDDSVTRLLATAGGEAGTPMLVGRVDGWAAETIALAGDRLASGIELLSETGAGNGFSGVAAAAAAADLAGRAIAILAEVGSPGFGVVRAFDGHNGTWSQRVDAASSP